VPRPIARAQAEDDLIPAPRPARLSMPSPEQLGIAAGKPATDGADWAALHRRLDHLTPLCCRTEKLAQGRFRVALVLPTAQADRSQHIEAEGDTEAEAAGRALDAAEAWAARR
jgi:hypothetical protein